LEARAAKASGVDFKLKDFRSAFAKMRVELDPDLKTDVSTILGHADIKTMQRYHAQVSWDSVGRRLETA
jgi:integrase